MTLLVGRITSIMSCRATAFSTISFSSEISQAKSNKPRLRLSSLAISLLRTPLTPLNLFAKLSLLSATQEVERSKVSHCKPSCSSSSRSIARPSRPQKSIKYVVSNVWNLDDDKDWQPTSACSLDKLHISWNVDKSRINIRLAWPDVTTLTQFFISLLGPPGSL